MSYKDLHELGQTPAQPPPATAENILVDPLTAPLPSSVAEVVGVAQQGCYPHVTLDTSDTYMRYVERFPLEWQGVVLILMTKHSTETQRNVFHSVRAKAMIMALDKEGML